MNKTAFLVTLNAMDGNDMKQKKRCIITKYNLEACGWPTYLARL
jgi:hypothetical protein